MRAQYVHKCCIIKKNRRREVLNNEESTHVHMTNVKFSAIFSASSSLHHDARAARHGDTAGGCSLPRGRPQPPATAMRTPPTQAPAIVRRSSAWRPTAQPQSAATNQHPPPHPPGTPGPLSLARKQASSPESAHLPGVGGLDRPRCDNFSGCHFEV